MRNAAHRHGATRQRGFTLVELLVAVAIFVTVMASVALVFNGAVRTSKQGFQNQEAYELARGAMKVIERDLSRAFTNRNHGDVFSFYGTPIGFTYVGLIQADESSAPNMARVTYVVYHLASTNDNIAGAVAQYQSKDGIDVPTYQLLRYIEPGADNLDSFPVNWAADVTPDVGSPITLNDVVNTTVARAGCSTGDTKCGELVRQAAQRELWILMLSGGGLIDLDGNPDTIEGTVPSAWEAGAWNAMPVFANRDPADYVVAESIRYMGTSTFDINTGTPYCASTDLNSMDFDDLVYQNGNQTCVLRVDSSTVPPWFEPATPALFSMTNGPRPFFTYWDVGVQQNLQVTDPVTGVVFNDPGLALGENTITANDKVGQIAFQFWNDSRNLQSDGLDNDGDGVIDLGPDLIFGTSDDDLDEIYGENAGSPLDTRLPVAVTVDFTLFFRSPYPGAPDFNERFTQRIDLPTAYRRTFKQRVADPTP